MPAATASAAITAAALLQVGVKVNSTAIKCWAVSVADDGNFDLLILFNSGDTVYTYRFVDSAAMYQWDLLRQDPDTSWGQQLHRRIKAGEILTV